MISDGSRALAARSTGESWHKYVHVLYMYCTCTCSVHVSTSLMLLCPISLIWLKFVIINQRVLDSGKPYMYCTCVHNVFFLCTHLDIMFPQTLSAPNWVVNVPLTTTCNVRFFFPYRVSYLDGVASLLAALCASQTSQTHVKPFDH